MIIFKDLFQPVGRKKVKGRKISFKKESVLCAVFLVFLSIAVVTGSENSDPSGSSEKIETERPIVISTNFAALKNNTFRIHKKLAKKVEKDDDIATNEITPSANEASFQAKSHTVSDQYDAGRALPDGSAATVKSDDEMIPDQIAAPSEVQYVNYVSPPQALARQLKSLRGFNRKEQKPRLPKSFQKFEVKDGVSSSGGGSNQNKSNRSAAGTTAKPSSASSTTVKPSGNKSSPTRKSSQTYLREVVHSSVKPPNPTPSAGVKYPSSGLREIRPSGGSPTDKGKGNSAYNTVLESAKTGTTGTSAPSTPYPFGSRTLKTEYNGQLPTASPLTISRFTAENSMGSNVVNNWQPALPFYKKQLKLKMQQTPGPVYLGKENKSEQNASGRSDRVSKQEKTQSAQSNEGTKDEPLTSASRISDFTKYDTQGHYDYQPNPEQSSMPPKSKEGLSQEQRSNRPSAESRRDGSQNSFLGSFDTQDMPKELEYSSGFKGARPPPTVVPVLRPMPPGYNSQPNPHQPQHSPPRGPPPPGFQGFQHRPGPGGFPDGFRNSPPPRFSDLQNLDIGSPPSTEADFNKLSSPSSKSREHQRSNSPQRHHSSHHSSHQQHQATPFSLSAIEQAHMMNGFGDFGGFHGSNIPAAQSRPTSEPLVRIKGENSHNGGFGFNDFPPLQDAFSPNEGFNPFSESDGEQNGGPNGRHFGSFHHIPDSFPKIPGPEADDFKMHDMKDGSFEMPGNEGPDNVDHNDRPHSGEISEHGKHRDHTTSGQSSKESLDAPGGTSRERESDSPNFGRSSREQEPSDHPIEEDEPKIENQSHQEHDDPEESPRDFSPNGPSGEGGSSRPRDSPFPGSSREETDNHSPPTSSHQMHQLPGVSVENMRSPFSTKRPFFPTRAPFNGGTPFRGSTERERFSTTTTTKPGFRGNFNQGKKTGHKFNSYNTDKPEHAESSERFPGFGGFSIEQKVIGAQRPSHNEKSHLQQNTPSGFNGFQEFGKPFFKQEDGPDSPNGFNDNFKPSLMFSPPSDMPRFPSQRPSERPALINGDFDDIDGPFSNEQSEDGPDVLGINDIEGLDYKESSGDSSRPSSGQSQKIRGGVANFLGPGFIRGGGFGPFGNPLAGKPPPGPPPSLKPPSAGPGLFGKPLPTPPFANPHSRPSLSSRPSLFGKPLQAPPFASSPLGPSFSGAPGIFGKPPQGPSSFGASPFFGGPGIFGKPPGSPSDAPFSAGPGIFGKPFPAAPFGGPAFGSPPSNAPLAVGQGIFGKPLQAPPFGGSPIMKPVSGSFAAPLPGPFNAPLGSPSPAPSGGFLKNIIGGSGSLFKNPLGSTGSVPGLSGFTSPFKSSFPETSPIKGFMSSPAGPPPAFPAGGSFGPGPGPGDPSSTNPPQTLVGPLVNALGTKGLTGALMNTIMNAFPSLVFGNNAFRGSLRPSAPPPPPGTLSGSAGSMQPTAGNQQGRPITSQTVPLRSSSLPGTRPEVQHDPTHGDHHDQDVSGSDEHALVQHQHRPQLSPGGFAGFSHWFSELFDGFTVKTHKAQASPSPYNEIAHGTKPLQPYYNSHKPQHIKLRHPVKKVKLPLKKILTPILDFAHKVLSFYAQFSIDKDHYIRVISFAGVYLFFAWLFKDSAEHALLPRCEPWGWGGPEEHSFHAPARFLPAPPVDRHLQQEFFHLFRGIENCLDEKVEKDKKKKKKKKDKKKKKKDSDKHKKKHGNGNGNGNDNDNDRGRGFSDDSEEDDDGGSGSIEAMEAEYAYELKYINDMCPRGQFFYSMSPIQREAIDALAAIFVAQPTPAHVLHVARSLLHGRSVHPKVWYYALIAAQGQRPDMLGLQIPHPLDAMPDNYIPGHLIEYDFKRYRGLVRRKRSLLPGPTGNGTSEFIIEEKGGSSNVIFVNSTAIFTAPSQNLSVNDTKSSSIELEKGFLPGLNGTSFKQSKSRKDEDSENESDEEEDDEIDEDDYDDDRKENKKKHPLGYGFGFIGDGYGSYKKRPPVKFGLGPNGENHNGFFAPHGQVSNPYGRPIDHILPPAFSDGKQKGKKKDKKKKKKKNKKDKCIIVDGSVGLDNGIENKLWYWREDMMMNQHHWYWHQNYPVNASRHGDRAAELFFYMHRQFIARYDAERLSNGFARTVPLPLVPGAIIEEKYNPHIKDFHSGKYWSARPPHTPINDVLHVHDPDVGRNILMQEVVDLQSKFIAAIKWGGLVSAEGLFLPIRFHNGIMPLVNTVEATNLSVNPMYYNTFGLHNLGHLVVGFAQDNDWSKHLTPGPMADVTQSMKDPAFFSYHLTLDDLMDKFKQSLPPYKPYGGVWPLEWHGVEIVDVTLDTLGIRPNNHLTTFFIKHKFQLEPGVDRSIAKGIAKANVCAVHMDHAPFQYKITIDMKKCASSKSGQGTIRIFMAPRYSEHGDRLSLLEQRRIMFQLDAFQADLKVGRNLITRNAKDSALTRPWTRSLKDYMKRPDYSGVAEPCGCGWPQHLLIPKGNTKGMAFDIFVMVTNFDEDYVIDDPEDLKIPESCNAAYIFCGRARRKYPDSRPMGYPFDRLPYRVPEHKCGYGEKMNMKDLLCRLTGKIFTRPVATLEEYVSGVTNMAMTVAEIKHIPKVIGKHSG